MSNYQLVYVTCPSREEAKELAQGAVEAKLAACANIVPQIESVFHWEDKVQSSTESLLILKTTKTNFEKLQAFIEEKHSYYCPCVLGLDIADLNSKFAEFITSSVS